MALRSTTSNNARTAPLQQNPHPPPRNRTNPQKRQPPPAKSVSRMSGQIRDPMPRICPARPATSGPESVPARRQANPRAACLPSPAEAVLFPTTPARNNKPTDGALRAAKQIEHNQSFLQSTAETIDRETGVRELTDILENIITEAGDLAREVVHAISEDLSSKRHGMSALDRKRHYRLNFS